METHYKTLVFKSDRTKVLGRFAIPMENSSDWAGCNIPMLLTTETTIRKLENIYKNHNFKGVKLIVVKLSEIETNNG